MTDILIGTILFFSSVIGVLLPIAIIGHVCDRWFPC